MNPWCSTEIWNELQPSNQINLAYFFGFAYFWKIARFVLGLDCKVSLSLGCEFDKGAPSMVAVYVSDYFALYDISELFEEPQNLLFLPYKI